MFRFLVYPFSVAFSSPLFVSLVTCLVPLLILCINRYTPYSVSVPCQFTALVCLLFSVIIIESISLGLLASCSSLQHSYTWQVWRLNMWPVQTITRTRLFLLQSRMWSGYLIFLCIVTWPVHLLHLPCWFTLNQLFFNNWQYLWLVLLPVFEWGSDKMCNDSFDFVTCIGCRDLIWHLGFVLSQPFYNIKTKSKSKGCLCAGMFSFVITWGWKFEPNRTRMELQVYLKINKGTIKTVSVPTSNEDIGKPTVKDLKKHALSHFPGVNGKLKISFTLSKINYFLILFDFVFPVRS